MPQPIKLLNKKRLAAVVLACATLPVGTAKAGDIKGQASVIDGDTFKIHSQRSLLHGIVP